MVAYVGDECSAEKSGRNETVCDDDEEDDECESSASASCAADADDAAMVAASAITGVTLWHTAIAVSAR